MATQTGDLTGLIMRDCVLKCNAQRPDDLIDIGPSPTDMSRPGASTCYGSLPKNNALPVKGTPGELHPVTLEERYTSILSHP
ncbi:hypothetical protein MAE02_23400 [Microvirga aerophila]|uniref:Uncharacterized protein n=1 Tax=Microvirga aerophila TaxID=670291 RepID=A0A512BRW7_9HYPH|nr:hypothetical protein MAE02_23400 [Microvirga aerophila]